MRAVHGGFSVLRCGAFGSYVSFGRLFFRGRTPLVWGVRLLTGGGGPCSKCPHGYLFRDNRRFLTNVIVSEELLIAASRLLPGHIHNLKIPV